MLVESLKTVILREQMKEALRTMALEKLPPFYGNNREI